MASESNNQEQSINLKNIDLSRQAAEITLARIDNVNELWAETKQQGDKVFIQKTKEVWKDFAVHGILGFDKKDNKNKIFNFTDLDGKCSLALLKKAGLNTNNVNYLTPGEFVEGKINIDTGYKDGFIIQNIDKNFNDGNTVFMDHHGAESGNDSSATKIVYEILTSLSLLKKEEYLDNLVKFVTQMDNKTFPVSEEDFKNSYKTIIGLQRFINPKHLFNFFEQGKKPTDILNYDELSKMGLTQKSSEQKEMIDLSIKQLAEINRKNNIINSKNHGKIVIDIDNTFVGGLDVIKAFGYGGYVIWNPQKGSFFINTVDKLPKDFSLSQGRRIRDNMWVKPKITDSNPEPLKIELKEIVEKIAK